MKGTAAISGIILLGFQMISCVSEDYLSCPDFGKYRVTFSTVDSLRFPEKMYMSLIYKEESNLINLNGSGEFVKDACKAGFTSEKILKLPPGDFRFSSLSCTSPLIIENGMCKMFNGKLFLFADTLGRVVKRYENSVKLNLYPVNSLILAQCILDNDLAKEYEIKDFAISAPDDSNVLINQGNGVASYSDSITDFYDHFELSSDGTLFRYYCVPFRGGCYVNFRITLALRNSNTAEGKDAIRVLLNRLYLKSDIEQGKLYRFTFEVSALEINCKSTSVSDWTDYQFDGEIPVI